MKCLLNLSQDDIQAEHLLFLCSIHNFYHLCIVFWTLTNKVFLFVIYLYHFSCSECLPMVSVLTFLIRKETWCSTASVWRGETWTRKRKVRARLVDVNTSVERSFFLSLVWRWRPGWVKWKDRTFGVTLDFPDSIRQISAPSTRTQRSLSRKPCFRFFR